MPVRASPRSTTTAVAQERLLNTLRWRCAAPAVTASCAASRLAERARSSTRHDTAPNIPRLARVLPALCPQSLLLTLSPARLLCCTPTRAPPIRRAGAKRSLTLFGGDTSCCASDSGQPRDPAKLRLSLTGRPTKMARLPSPRRQEDCRSTCLC